MGNKDTHFLLYIVFSPVFYTPRGSMIVIHKYYLTFSPNHWHVFYVYTCKHLYYAFKSITDRQR